MYDNWLSKMETRFLFWYQNGSGAVHIQHKLDYKNWCTEFLKLVRVNQFFCTPLPFDQAFAHQFRLHVGSPFEQALVQVSFRRESPTNALWSTNSGLLHVYSESLGNGLFYACFDMPHASAHKALAAFVPTSTGQGSHLKQFFTLWHAW